MSVKIHPTPFHWVYPIVCEEILRPLRQVDDGINPYLSPNNDSHLLLVDWRVNPPAAVGFCSGDSDPPANREAC